jgi:uncharacterized membrane protein HdeD (DUF308 family)
MLKGVWWMFLLKGIIAILFGLLALLGPGVAALSLLMAFGVYALVDGVSTVWGAVKGRKADGSWWLLALEGLLGVWIGWMALSRPGEITLAFLVLFALWAIFGGVLRIITAIRLRKEIQGEWMMIASGAISVLFGTFLLTQPLAGVLAMMWAVGIFAIIIGVIMVMLAMKARGFANKVAEARA